MRNYLNKLYESMSRRMKAVMEAQEARRVIQNTRDIRDVRK